MTQAVNLANFANNLDTSGGMNPSALNAAVPLSKGGTNATDAAGARTSLGLAIGTNVPSPTGTGASGTWPISISGNSATSSSPASGGSFITSSNIGSQSVSYASTAGNGGVTSVNGNTGAVTVNAFGISQTYQDVSASRSLNTTYTNSTGKPIMIWIEMGYGDLAMYIGSRLIWFFSQGSSARAQMIVPPGETYSATAASGRYFNYWYEYR